MTVKAAEFAREHGRTSVLVATLHLYGSTVICVSGLLFHANCTISDGLTSCWPDVEG